MFIILLTVVMLRSNYRFFTGIRLLSAFYLYLVFFLTVIGMTTLFGVNPPFSFVRVVVSTSLLALIFTVMYFFNYTLYHDLKRRKILAFSLFLLLAISVVGQLFIDDWSSGAGGIRLSGGINPNQMALLAFFVVIFTSLNRAITGESTKKSKLLWLLATIVLFWTMSRSLIFSFFIFYFVLIAPYILKNLLSGHITKKFFRQAIGIFALATSAYFTFRWLQSSPNYIYLVERFTGSSGLDTRSAAWDILMPYFYSNPLFGGVGWWYSSELLANTNSYIASSPHNLYVRLLAESGIIGLTITMLLPMVLSILLIIRYQQTINKSERKALLISLASIISLFASQYAEDRYLVGLVNFGNVIIIWSMALAYFLLTKDKMTPERR
ncbi:O-antigen ligase family protein [Shouchella shacheensis]|uniref:O-antigen ligase family protein n=1 Tax=Shouchella shacheensis TaxID=1649580 RepID=UPI00073FDD01|nr:O-antigen ligase family protein [Shouchella shacheensis]